MREKIAPIAGSDGGIEDLNDLACLLVLDQTGTLFDQLRHAPCTVTRGPKPAAVGFTTEVQKASQSCKEMWSPAWGLHDRGVQVADLFLEFRVREHHAHERHSQ